MRPLLIVLSCAVVLHVPAAAQPAAPVQGDRVRINATTVSGKFTVAEVRPDGWLLDAEDQSAPFVLPFSSVRRLAVLRGERSASAAAGRGALIGAGVGAVFALLFDSAMSAGGSSMFSLTNDDRVIVYGGLMGSGALLGSALGKSDREIWERVQSPVSVGTSPGGGAMLRLSIRSGRAHSGPGRFPGE